MLYMAHRTQIYLTDEQRARLDERARREERPMAQLVRDAVDEYLAGADDLEATFGSAPGIAGRIPPRSEWDRSEVSRADRGAAGTPPPARGNGG